MLLTVIAASSGAAFFAYSVAGRVIGLGVTAVCGALMAFFCMPPVFSFRVSHMHDVFALVAYGAVGVVLAGATPLKIGSAKFDTISTNYNDAPGRVETDVATTIAELLSSDFGNRLVGIDVLVYSRRATLERSRSETKCMVFDVLAMALLLPGVQRISIFNAYRPGVRQLIVVARYTGESQCGRVITIGKRDEDCEQAAFPDWPPGCRVTYFDNGFDRIFQISVEEESRN